MRQAQGEMAVHSLSNPRSLSSGCHLRNDLFIGCRPVGSMGAHAGSRLRLRVWLFVPCSWISACSPPLVSGQEIVGSLLRSGSGRPASHSGGQIPRRTISLRSRSARPLLGFLSLSPASRVSHPYHGAGYIISQSAARTGRVQFQEAVQISSPFHRPRSHHAYGERPRGTPPVPDLYAKSALRLHAGQPPSPAASHRDPLSVLHCDFRIVVERDVARVR